MQVALSIALPVLPLLPSRNTQLIPSPAKAAGSVSYRRSAIKASAMTYDSTTVDYGSAFSVFPAEACETIGGDACLADIFPEVKLPSEARNEATRIASEEIDREYFEYNSAKTVFCAEACDDLGGEFCGSEYQRGVY